MISKYHNHTPQSNPWHREKKPQNIYNTKTSVQQLKQNDHLSLPLKDGCKARMGIKLCITNQSKKDGKDQEMIQSSNAPDPGYHMGK